jgi:tetratricopeptide (TPR) repeat protein
MTNDSRSRAKEYADRGNDYWKQGNHSSAIEWLTRALAEDLDDPSALLHRGAARAAMSDISGAAADVQRAKQLLSGDGNSKRRRWASAQLGEAIRLSIRDGVPAPPAGMAEVEAQLATMDASIEAFSDALQEDANDAWAYAHRGAVSMLAYWLGSRFGVDPARVRRYAESARSDLDAAIRLNGSYSWAMTSKGILLVNLSANAPDDAERRALFAETIALMEEAGHVDKRFPTLHMLTELALQTGEYEKVIEFGWAQLAKNAEDLRARYCMAGALTQIAETNGAGDPAVEEGRRVSAASFAEQARRAMLAQRSQIAAMLGGLAMLERRYDEAAAMLNDVLEYPDMETLGFMRSDPMWAPARGPAAGAESDARLRAVIDAYAKLFPPASSEESSPR